MEEKGLLDAFSDLQKFGAELRQATTYRIPYRSTLATILKSLEAASAKKDSQSSIDLAKLSWNEYLKTGLSFHITNRTIRILSGDSEICTSQPFLYLLSRMGEIRSTRILMNLLTIYHLKWEQPEVRKGIESILLPNLADYSGRNRRIVFVLEQLNYLVGKRAPDLLGAVMAAEGMTLAAVTAWLQLPLRNTYFGRYAAGVAMMTAAVELFSKTNFDLKKWAYVIDLLEGQDTTVNTKLTTITTLIRALDRLKHVAPWDEAQVQFKDICLARLSDPRINPSKWIDLPKDVMDIFIAWLCEEDLALFFELIITNDPHHRKKFWMQYVRGIVRSRVIVCEEDFWRFKTKLDSLQRKGRSFAVGTGLPASAFVLDFGSFVAVEFSQPGNACFVYDSQTFGQIVQNFYSQRVLLLRLKDPERASWRQVHHQGWTDRLMDELVERRIFRDSERNVRRR